MKQILRRFIRRPRGRRPVITAASLLAAVVLFFSIAGIITRYDPLEQDIDNRLQPPSSTHIFGTDGFGRDVFSRVVYGGRITLYIALSAVIVACVVGIPLGTYMAYAGGFPDLLIGRLIDSLLGFPLIVLAIIVVVALQASPVSVAIAITAIFVPRIATLTRSAAQLTNRETYIQAAVVTGAKPSRIIFRHLIPNSAGPPISQAVGYIGGAITTESTLSYLGLGVPPPYPSWGRMLQEGTRLYFESAPWLVIFPGITLCLVVVCFSLLAERLKKVTLSADRGAS